MSCVRCAGLLRTFRSAQRSYDSARASSFYVVSAELAAQKQVAMERAKNDLFDHQKICRPPALPQRTAAG